MTGIADPLSSPSPSPALLALSSPPPVRPTQLPFARRKAKDIGADEYQVWCRLQEAVWKLEPANSIEEHETHLLNEAIAVMRWAGEPIS